MKPYHDKTSNVTGEQISASWLTETTIQRVPVALSLGLKQPEGEAGHRRRLRMCGASVHCIICPHNL